MLNAAEDVDAALRQGRDDALQWWFDSIPEGGVRSPEEQERDVEESRRRMREGERINDELLTELVRACRGDIESLD